jgi:hypothetical protein
MRAAALAHGVDLDPETWAAIERNLREKLEPASPAKRRKPAVRTTTAGTSEPSTRLRAKAGAS